MQQIWKFILDPSGVVSAPEGAKFLSVAEQREDICCWALVDPQAPTVQHQLHVVPTGAPVDESQLGDFLGTVLLNGGSLVFHFFAPKGA